MKTQKQFEHKNENRRLKEQKGTIRWRIRGHSYWITSSPASTLPQRAQLLWTWKSEKQLGHTQRPPHHIGTKIVKEEKPQKERQRNKRDYEWRERMRGNRITTTKKKTLEILPHSPRIHDFNLSLSFYLCSFQVPKMQWKEIQRGLIICCFFFFLQLLREGQREFSERNWERKRWEKVSNPHQNLRERVERLWPWIEATTSAKAAACHLLFHLSPLSLTHSLTDSLKRYLCLITWALIFLIFVGSLFIDFIIVKY